jgi:hypothetical protein
MREARPMDFYIHEGGYLRPTDFVICGRVSSFFATLSCIKYIENQQVA